MSLIALRVPCGAGKTHAAEEIAVERAREGKKTAITSPTHAIARESAARLRAAGVRVAYRSAPHRVLDRATGAPYCRRLSEAEALATSGLSVMRELCLGLGGSPCKFKDTCPGATGLDTDADPLVWVGPHQLIDEAVAFTQPDGLLVVDEPPDAVNVSTVKLDDLGAAHEAAGDFRYHRDLRWVIESVIHGISEGATAPRQALDIGAPMALADDRVAKIMLRTAKGRTPGEQLLHLLRGAVGNDYTPKLSEGGLAAIHGGREIKTAKTIATLGRALLDDGAASARVRDNQIVLVEIAWYLRAAISRAPNVVLIDATLDVEGLEALLGRKVPVQDVAVSDGAPVERVWIVCSSANRRAWLPHGRVEPKNLIGPLREALEVVAEDPARRQLGIVTFAGLERAISEAWAAGKAEGLAEALEPWRDRGGDIGLLHYGAVRGRNDFNACDAVVTLGDPWPDLAAHEARAETLGLDFRASYERAVRAELAQASGRLRAPRRRRPALAVHVGRVLPEGWEEHGVRVVELGRGRPRAAAQGVSGAVLAAWRAELGLSRRAAAKLLSVGETTLRRLECA